MMLLLWPIRNAVRVFGCYIHYYVNYESIIVSISNCNIIFPSTTDSHDLQLLQYTICTFQW